MTIRKRITLMLLPLLVCGWMLVLRPSPVHACDCVRPPGPETALRHSDAVFAGEVLSVREARGLHGVVEATFRVSEAWKGAGSDRVTVRTEASQASCGFAFEVGQRYLVYAEKSSFMLRTGLCTRTTDLALAAEDLAALGRGTVPPPSPEPDMRDRRGLYASTALAAASALVFAILLLRFRRRHRTRQRRGQ